MSPRIPLSLWFWVRVDQERDMGGRVGRPKRGSSHCTWKVTYTATDFLEGAVKTAVCRLSSAVWASSCPWSSTSFDCISNFSFSEPRPGICTTERWEAPAFSASHLHCWGFTWWEAGIGSSLSLFSLSLHLAFLLDCLLTYRDFRLLTRYRAYSLPEDSLSYRMNVVHLESCLV